MVHSICHVMATSSYPISPHKSPSHDNKQGSHTPFSVHLSYHTIVTSRTSTPFPSTLFTTLSRQVGHPPPTTSGGVNIDVPDVQTQVLKHSPAKVDVLIHIYMSELLVILVAIHLVIRKKWSNLCVPEKMQVCRVWGVSLFRWCRYAFFGG